MFLNIKITNQQIFFTFDLMKNNTNTFTPYSLKGNKTLFEKSVRIVAPTMH